MPTFTVNYDGTPLNTTTVNAGALSVATASTGLWDTAAIGTQGAWRDLLGNKWSNTGTGGYFQAPTTGFADRYSLLAIRPDAEIGVNHAVKVYFPAGQGSTVSMSAALRFNADYKDHYQAEFFANFFQVVLIQGGVLARISVPAPSAAVTYDASKAYSIYFEAVGLYPTTMTAILRNETDGIVLSTLTWVDSTATTCQRAGLCGITSWSSAGGTAKASRVITYSAPFTDFYSYDKPTVTVGSSSITLSCPTAHQNTGAITYQLQRATTSGGTFADIGASGQTATDSTAVSGTTYFYRFKCTDSAANVCYSRQSPGTIQPPVTITGSLARVMKVGFLGDSIIDPSQYTSEVAAGEALTSWTDTQTCNYLVSRYGATSATSVNGGKGGRDTGDFLPGTTFYNSFVSAALTAGVTIVLLELGPNDARLPPNTFTTNSNPRPVGTKTDASSATTGSYMGNMNAIVNGLVSNGFKVVLSQPHGIMRNTRITTATFSDLQINAMMNYGLALPTLVDNVNVFILPTSPFGALGNHETTDYYHEAGNPSNGAHPNQLGVNLFATLWSDGIALAAGLTIASGQLLLLNNSSMSSYSDLGM